MITYYEFRYRYIDGFKGYFDHDSMHVRGYCCTWIVILLSMRLMKGEASP